MNFFEKFFVNRFNEFRVPRTVFSMLKGANLQISGLFLEIGAGLGYTSLKIFDKYHPEKVVITDYDPNQVKDAERYALKKYGSVPSEIHFQREDALQLSFEDETFDFVLGTLCFHHIETRVLDFVNTPKALEQIYRVLKPNGHFIYWDRYNRDKIDEFFLSHGGSIQYSGRGKAIYRKT